MKEHKCHIHLDEPDCLSLLTAIIMLSFYILITLPTGPGWIASSVFKAAENKTKIKIIPGVVWCELEIGNMLDTEKIFNSRSLDHSGHRYAI